MTTTNNLNLTKEQKTLFLTLCGKALDYRSKNSILKDSRANEIIEELGLELKQYSDSKNRITAVRARQFDEWINNFISRNGDAVVVNLGCGLDTRISRIQPGSQIDWYDVDFAEVINLRKRFYSDQKNYLMLASSVTDDAWLQKIPNHKPTIIVAEGLMSYLSKEEVKTLLSRITNYFEGGEITFNVISELAKQKGIKTLGAIQKMTVENVKEIDELNTKMKRVETLSLFKSEFIKGLPIMYRTLLGLASGSKKYQNMIQLLKYEF